MFVRKEKKKVIERESSSFRLSMNKIVGVLMRYYAGIERNVFSCHLEFFFLPFSLNSFPFIVHPPIWQKRFYDDELGVRTERKNVGSVDLVIPKKFKLEKEEKTVLRILQCWMPESSLLLTDKNDQDNLNSSPENTEKEQLNIWSGIPRRENNVCTYLFIFIIIKINIFSHF
jgi:hypothetical protein